MEIRQLKYFIAIAECNSFSEASRRCFLSQSAISQQIKLLEEELNTTLFNRSSHKVELTQSGEIFLPLAKKVIKSVCDCQEKMADINEVLSGDLSIGLTYSLEAYVRHAMVKFMKLYPQVHLKIYYKTIPEMIRMLRNGELDMAFSIKVEGEEDWVDSLPIIEYECRAVMNVTHPLSKKAEISFKDLENQGLIVPELGKKDRNPIEYYLHHDARNLKVRATINDPCAILNLLKLTNYICLMSQHTIDGIDELTSVKIKELSEPNICYVHRLKGAYCKKSSEVFLDILRESIEERQKYSNLFHSVDTSCKKQE